MLRSLVLVSLLVAGCGGDPAVLPVDVPSDASARIAARTFPSIFQAWNAAQNLNSGPSGPTVALSSLEPAEATIARHDGWPWKKTSSPGSGSTPRRLGLRRDGRGVIDHPALALACRAPMSILRPRPRRLQSHAS